MNHNIFAIELCVRMEPESRLQERLRQLLARHPALTTPGAKWELLRRLSELLLDHADLFEKGCWDFFDDDERARSDFEMWYQGMATEEGARKMASGRPGARDGEPRYLTFTIALLLKADTPCSRDLAKLCDIPEPQLWKRETFVRILKGLSRVSFSAVKGDVLYLIPRDEDWGLTAGDLDEKKFEYLRQIA